MSDLGSDMSGRPERHLGLWLTASALVLAMGLWASGTGARLAAVVIHGASSVNRTLPTMSPPAASLSFTATPADAEFLHAGVFVEPLVPVGATTPAENRELATAVLAYRTQAHGGTNRDAVEPLLRFLDSHPNSAWKPALQLNLGILYRQTGHFTKALEIWQQAWRNTQNRTDRNGRALGDATIARLTQFEAYLGRKEVLQPLLDEVRDRPVSGAASQVLTSSREGLFHMIARPERSFKCGPIALSRILLRDNPTPSADVMQVFEEAQSTPNGMSLSMVQQVSVKAGMNYQMAYREPGAAIITPAVAHWKAGHYAALEASDTDRYVVEDPTFGETIRVSAATLDEEGSGYFLVPTGALPAGWRRVPSAEGETIWGRGDTGNNKDSGDSGPPPPPPDSCNSSGGCTTWSVSPMLVSLSLHDDPVGYNPPVGPPVQFDLYYAQRDALQPQTFSYVNFGPKWTFTWLSYVTDNVASSAAATLYGRGGGSEPFTFSSTSATTSALGPFSESTLKRSVGAGGATTGFTRTMSDGSSEQFSLASGSQFFMTAVVDRFGNKVSLHYDSTMRIVAITDAIGQVTTLTYGLSSSPLVVTAITDPFGRSAKFTYNASGQLASITDVLGITSSYVYATADFISSLKTPYGTTVFSYGDATTNPSLGDTVFLKVTDPLQRTSYIEFNQTTTPIDVNATPPTGMNTCSCYLVYRNTFLFDPYQYQLATAAGGLDYSKGHLIHWLHTSDYSSTSRVKESEKQPLENRIWYNYPGQSSSITFGTSESGVSAPGTINSPSAMGQVLSNGTTQLQTIQYNAMGNVTSATDPVGRKVVYSYAANGIDVVSVANATSATPQVLASLSYNAHHQPTSITGPNGAAYKYAYNSAGQTTQLTDQLGNVTLLTYADGYLTSVTGPVKNSTFSLTYDHDGRVASATDLAGSTVSYAFDAADRPTMATYPDGTSVHFAYNLLDLVKVTDRLGRVTTVNYDANREPIALVDPLGQTVSFGYNVAGKLNSVKDPNGHSTLLTLDSEGRPTTKTYPDGTTQLWSYDAAVNLVATTTDAVQQKTAYTYNTDNTPATITYSGDSIATAAVAMQYDSNYARPVAMTDGIGTTTYTYYPVSGTPTLGANQVQTVTSPIANTAGGSDTVTYTYDAMGRVVGRSVNGNVQQTVFDSLGRVTSITGPLDTFTYSYGDATPRLSTLTSLHGPNVSLAYFGSTGDELLQQITYVARAGQTLSQFGYTYNANDNVTSFTDSYLNQNAAIIAAAGGPAAPAASLIASATAPAATTAPAAAVPGPTQMLLAAYKWVGLAAHPPSAAQVTTYAYDNADRMVSALVTATGVPTPSKPQFLYGYDRSSNLTSITANAPAQSYSYSATNELTNGVYNANGTPSSLGTTKYGWDGAQRLVSFTSGTTKSQFYYDGLSRLVRIVDEKAGHVVADHAYLWCGTERCLERDNTQPGSPVSKQYFTQGVIASGTHYYYVMDQLGSVRQLVNTAGAVAVQYDYDPYGNQLKISGSIASDFGFAGMFHHAASGLDFAVLRAYDPVHARWLNRDPAGEAGAVNLYSYVAGNPASLFDPSGLCKVDVRFKQIGPFWYHAYVVTTDPTGSQTFFRGGPSTSGPSSGGLGGLSSGSGGSSSGSSGSNSSGSSNSSNSSSPGSGAGGPGQNNGPWGPITTDTGPYVPGSIDWETGSPPSVTVSDDDQPCTCDNKKLADALQNIQAQQIPYNPLSTNSNATANTILQQSGFGSATPPVWAPGWSTPLPTGP